MFGFSRTSRPLWQPFTNEYWQQSNEVEELFSGNHAWGYEDLRIVLSFGIIQALLYLLYKIEFLNQRSTVAVFD